MEYYNWAAFAFWFIYLCSLVVLFSLLKKSILTYFKVLESLKESLKEKRYDTTLPLSGFWIKCRDHGSLPLTEIEYLRQCRIDQYRCPICKVIPRKIWKKK